MRCVLFIFINSHIHQRAVHPLPHFLGRDADIFQTEGDILFYYRCHNLVVRILKDHPDLLANIIQPLLIGGVDAVHIDFAARREQNCVEMLGKGTFSRAVVSQHRCHFPFADGYVEVFKDIDRFLVVLHTVAEADRLGFNKIVHPFFYHLF